MSNWTKKCGFCPPGRGTSKFFNKRIDMIFFFQKRIILVAKWRICWVWVFGKEMELGGGNFCVANS